MWHAFGISFCLILSIYCLISRDKCFKLVSSEVFKNDAQIRAAMLETWKPKGNQNSFGAWNTPSYILVGWSRTITLHPILQREMKIRKTPAPWIHKTSLDLIINKTKRLLKKCLSDQIFQKLKLKFFLLHNTENL